MDYPKSLPGIGLVGGKFADANPTTGAPGSWISAAWANSLMDELLGVIEGAGLAPSEASNTQLLQAIKIHAAGRLVASTPNWYYVFPGGLIVQGGYTQGYSGYTITLPAAFPNGVLGQPVACGVGSDVAAVGAAAFAETSKVIGSQFKIFTYTPPASGGGQWGQGPRAVTWLAFGH
ncbi:gp53-like domain-containing protein [Alcaligenes sp. HNGD-HTN06]|uniref:gp53-like domain-containing protein n=1 Tax=Alcaligenes sp. HNGD-HTN06 TaxID=3416924 RepID=UPI003CEEDA52